MTLEELRKQLEAALEKRTSAHDAAMALIDGARGENRELNPEESAKLLEHRGAKKEQDSKIEELRTRISELEDEEKRDAAAAEVRKSLGVSEPRARVTREAPIYERRGRSWFADMRNAARNDGQAIERLMRNTRMTFEARAVDMTTTAGAGGEFAPPLWLIREWVKFLRPGRVTADLIGPRPLPAGVSSINLPKVAGGSATAVQATQGSAVQDTAMTTSSVSTGILTIAGQQTVSLQLLEQSGINFDDVILSDLAADYAKQFDTQVLTASAAAPWSGGGLANVSGAGAVTYTDASPAVAGAGKFYAKVANAIETVATTRFMDPTAIVMHPRRWAWVLAAFDSSNRPLVVPSGQGFNVAALSSGEVADENSMHAVGQMLGLPVYTDANIPTNLGAGTNQDVVYVLREADLYLYETELHQAQFDATYAGSLEMLFRVHAYAGFIANRYPSAICAINGTGLVTPSF